MLVFYFIVAFVYMYHVFWICLITERLGTA